MNELLFSYGTLQLEKVQIESFGRKLTGTEDILPAYTLQQVKIVNKDVLAKSEQIHHPIAVYSGKPDDEIKGILFEISEEELMQADTYEVEDYQRIEATFKSGKKRGFMFKQIKTKPVYHY